MYKIINWVTKLIIQTMLVTGLTIYLTWVTVHTYVDKLLAKYHINTEQSKVQFSDFLSQVSNSMNILKGSNAQNQAIEESPGGENQAAMADVPTEGSTSVQVQNETEGIITTTATPSPNIEASANPTTRPSANPSPIPTAKPAGKTASSSTPPDDSVSVWKQASGEDQDKELVMSAEQFTKKKDQISESDKVEIFTLLASRLPQKEFQKISTYVEDGVTEKEWTDIQAIVEKYVEPDEFKQLQDLLAQY